MTEQTLKNERAEGDVVDQAGVSPHTTVSSAEHTSSAPTGGNTNETTLAQLQRAAQGMGPEAIDTLIDLLTAVRDGMSQQASQAGEDGEEAPWIH